MASLDAAASFLVRVMSLMYVLSFSALPVSTLQTLVNWTPVGVGKLQHKITIRAGDELTFTCPKGAFSTIWYMVSEQQYTNCDCGSSICIRVSKCLFLGASNYTTVIQRTSETIQQTPDYQPGRTYFFASFFDSENFSSISNPSQSGGECQSHMLRLEVEVLENDDSEPCPSPKPTKPTTPTEPPTDSNDKGSGDDRLLESLGDETDPVLAGLNTPSTSLSLLPSCSVLGLLIASLLTHLAN